MKDRRKICVRVCISVVIIIVIVLNAMGYSLFDLMKDCLIYPSFIIRN